MDKVLKIVEEDGTEYTWYGTFGCVFYSIESGVKVGDVRFFAGKLFYADSIRNPHHNRFNLFGPKHVNWVATDEYTEINTIHEYKLKIFGLRC